jgi:RNA polymerase sigma-70 factor (ECF subfamily)
MTGTKNWPDDEYGLIEQILKGQSDRFRILVDRYSPMVFHIVRGFEKDDDEVRELAQQIFVKAFEKLESFNRASKFSSWLYSLSMNHCRDYAKNVRRQDSRFSEMDYDQLQARMSDSSDPHRDLEKKQAALIMAESIEKLKTEYSEPLLMKYRDGLSYNAMSKRLGVSVSALKVRVHRARTELKSIIENQQGLL